MSRAPFPWLHIALFASLALASNLCNESSLLSAGNAYHFTNCLNVSFPSIPSNNVALVVEDSTIVALLLNTALLSLSNVTLRFMRCAILSDLSLNSGATFGLVVNGLTVDIISCSITFDTVARYSADSPAMFLVLSDPQAIDNLAITMANSTLNVTGFPSVFGGPKGILGFLNVNQDHVVSQLHNISVIIEDSRIDLLYAFLEESDGIVVRSSSDSSLICFAAHRKDNSSFVTSISDMYLSFRNITGRMEGSTGTTLVRSEGILNRLSIHVSNVTLQRRPMGRTQTAQCNAAVCWSSLAILRVTGAS